MTSCLRVAGTDPGDDAVVFEFEGGPVRAHPGESVAAALMAAGIRVLRDTARGAQRGVFCGMGVCQDCLVEIDGSANQRACMTKADGVRSVRRQRAVPSAEMTDPKITPTVPEAAMLQPEILVIGGGAGGLNAAAAAARAGARVLLVDERPQPGGQFYKQPLRPDQVPSVFAKDAQFAGGRALIEATLAAGVTILHGAQVWGAFEPLDLMILHDGASRLCRPKRLVVAAGAYERGLPVPGWTLPGVMTTGAAQTLLRSYQVLPGRRVLVAGNGPLNFQVALELARAGAEIAAVAELAPRPGLASIGGLARMLTSTAGLALRGRAYVAELSRRGIPLFYGHALAAIAPSDRGLKADLSPWPAARGASQRHLEVDAVCMGYGFMPSNEIPRALGCAHEFDPARGHLTTVRDTDCRTTIESVYAVGDCTGLGGAPAAEAEGIIAGLAAAQSLGRTLTLRHRRESAAARAALRRHRRFQAGLWALFRAPPLGTELTSPETVICRCEELSLVEIQSGFDDGTRTVGAVKRATRVGMGRCQGRYCGSIATALASIRHGLPVDEGAHWAPRPPAKPIRIGDIVGP